MDGVATRNWYDEKLSPETRTRIKIVVLALAAAIIAEKAIHFLFAVGVGFYFGFHYPMLFLPPHLEVVLPRVMPVLEDLSMVFMAIGIAPFAEEHARRFCIKRNLGIQFSLTIGILEFFLYTLMVAGLPEGSPSPGAWIIPLRCIAIGVHLVFFHINKRYGIASAILVHAIFNLWASFYSYYMGWTNFI